MFRKTKEIQQLSLFSSNHTLLKGQALSIYEDNNEWHNQFRTQITERINEKIFSPLFKENFGAPNASIRVLIGMMILKEARGWSDSQLFEECRFNLLVRSALCLPNFDDSIPAPSTYYLFRKRIVDRRKADLGDLMKEVFKDITKSQILEFEINGNKIRLDSSLFGSNIAWYSRYELIHETLRIAYASVADRVYKFLNESELTILKDLSKESGEKVSYRSNKSEIETKLTQLGVIIFKIISNTKEDTIPAIETLRELFEQQYEVIDGAVSPLPKEKIKATSIQSPHDPDCHYRTKGDQKIKGYSINVTETCNKDNKFNLITDIIVTPASVSDTDFFIPAVESSQEIIPQKIETANSDGAYHSEENQYFCKENNIDHVIGAIQGAPSRYDLSKDENGDLIVTDLETNTIIPSVKTKPRNVDSAPSWKIKDHNQNPRYFTQKDIDACFLRKKIASRTLEELNIRNNIEATIFQLGYHTNNKKTRYRSLIKHEMWSISRVMWINFVRLWQYIVNNNKNDQKIEQIKVLNCLSLANTSFNRIKMGFTEILVKIINKQLYNLSYLSIN